MNKKKTPSPPLPLPPCPPRLLRPLRPPSRKACAAAPCLPVVTCGTLHVCMHLGFMLCYLCTPAHCANALYSSSGMAAHCMAAIGNLPPLFFSLSPLLLVMLYLVLWLGIWKVDCTGHTAVASAYTHANSPLTGTQRSLGGQDALFLRGVFHLCSPFLSKDIGSVF